MNLRHDLIFAAVAALLIVGFVWRLRDMWKYGLFGHGGGFGFLYFGLFATVFVAVLWRLW